MDRDIVLSPGIVGISVKLMRMSSSPLLEIAEKGEEEVREISSKVTLISVIFKCLTINIINIMSHWILIN